MTMSKSRRPRIARGSGATAPEQALRKALRPPRRPADHVRRIAAKPPLASGLHPAPRSATARRSAAAPTAKPVRASRPSGGSGAAPWFVTNARRLRVMTIGWIVLFLVVFGQMASLQLRNPDSAADRVSRQRIRATRVAAERGDLVDRSGIPLAISVREWRLVADPMVIAASKTVESHAKTIGTRLGVDAAVIQKRLDRPGRYSIVARGLDEAKANAFRHGPGRLDGIAVEEEPRRVYPAGDLARSLLGSVRRSDQVGVSGLELKFDSLLHGNEGEMKVERDLKGGQIPTSPGIVRPAKRGVSYQLTIDRSLQYGAEGILAEAIKLTGAQTGIVMISDVRTGELLSVVNMTVGADGNIVNTGRNCAFVCSYELGSVGKAVTIAAALEEDVVSPSSRIVVPDRLQMWDKKFKDDENHPTMSWTPGEILVKSSNIGTIKIAKILGRDRLNAYLRSFGLGSKTSVDFPGESTGILPKPAKWSGTSIGTISIGQGIATTPAQMLEVYNTVANGGLRVPLRLLRATTDAQGRTREIADVTPRRVVSAQTAQSLTSMLADVVRNGTGKAAAFDGYTVAGKTGTAQKPDETGGYSKTKYVASFAGFFPAERPVLSAIVVLDEPKTSIYGSYVAAPLFSEIARMAAAYRRVEPSPGLRAQTRPEQPKSDRSLAYQRAVLRGGALTLAPATPYEAAQAAIGSVRMLGDAASEVPATGTTPSTLPQRVAIIDPTTGKIIVGQVAVQSTPSQTGDGVNAVAPTIAPTVVPGSQYIIPIIHGIPDLSSRAYDRQDRPRAVSTRMTLAPGATSHDGVDRPPPGSAAEFEARVAGNSGKDKKSAASTAESQAPTKKSNKDGGVTASSSGDEKPRDTARSNRRRTSVSTPVAEEPDATPRAEVAPTPESSTEVARPESGVVAVARPPATVVES